MGQYSGNHPRYSGQKYDAKEAYNKDLTDKARLHYLENSEHDKHAPKMCGSDHAPKMYGEPAAKFNSGLREASDLGKLDNNPKFKAAVDAAPKMSGDMGHNVLAEDMTSNSQSIVDGDAGYAGDGAPAAMMKALGKPAMLMKKGISSMCGMKK